MNHNWNLMIDVLQNKITEQNAGAYVVQFMLPRNLIYKKQVYKHKQQPVDSSTQK